MRRGRRRRGRPRGSSTPTLGTLPKCVEAFKSSTAKGGWILLLLLFQLSTPAASSPVAASETLSESDIQRHYYIATEQPEDQLVANSTSNHTLEVFPPESTSHASGFSKKGMAVCFIVLAGVVVGLVINFANLHTDFEDLRDFHRAYLGRQMLISEGKLTSREYLKAIQALQELAQQDRQANLSSPSEYPKTLLNGHAVSNANSGLAVSLYTIQEERRKRNPHCHCTFDAFVSARPPVEGPPMTPDDGDHDQLRDRVEWLSHHLPLLATDFIEDHDPEWRDLDYSIEVGPPPDDFAEFVRQYDCRAFSCGTAEQEDQSDLALRRNLLYQFRKWKQRRQKLWRIVVTERAKKEMSSGDHGGISGVARR